MPTKVILKPKRETPFKHYHPWLFSGAIAKVLGNAEDGEMVSVHSADNTFIAWGIYNSQSNIRVRLYSWQESEILTLDFWKQKLQSAIAYRRSLGFGMFTDKHSNAYRLVNSEADGLSGLTIDRYGDALCVQFTSLAMYHRRHLWYELLLDLLVPQSITLRTEHDMQKEEGILATDEVVFGSAPERQVICENGISYYVQLNSGQKTGFYLDQRANRAYVQGLSKDRRVLDLCCYSGGFALNAKKGGAAMVQAIDVSANAITLAKENALLNNEPDIIFQQADAFRYVDTCEQKYDLIVLDPPKMTHSRASVANALKGYLHLNSKSFSLLDSGGILVSCSCSGRVSAEDFNSVIKEAAFKAGKKAKIMCITGADTDHPVSVYVPESAYLKCIISYVE